MNKEVTKSIEGEEYVFYKLPISTSIPLLTDIIKVIGPALASLEGSKNDETSVLDRDIDVGQAVGLLCKNLDGEGALDIIKRLLSCTRYKGQSILDVLDARFSGEELLLMKVVKEAMGAQYGSFFDERSTLFAVLQEEGIAPATPRT